MPSACVDILSAVDMSTTMIGCCAPLAAKALSDDEAAVTAELFKALADPSRVRIVTLLASAGEPVCACNLNEGCITGALSMGEYEAGLEAAGFEGISVECRHEVADGMHGAIVKAVKTTRPEAERLPVVHPAAKAGCC